MDPTFPSPREIKTLYPLTEKEKIFVENSRNSAIDCFLGKDLRKLLIIGPCSIHDPIAILDYALRFKKLSEKVKKHFLLILRFFPEKSRSKFSWKGFVYDPKLDGSNLLGKGVLETRKLLVALTQLEIPTASELLDPFLVPYFQDIFSWGMIGARTASSQIHRQMVSAVSFPVGFKNTIDGAIEPAIHGATSARFPQTFPGIDEEGKICLVQSQGNPYTHVVLRGSDFPSQSNYDSLSIAQTLKTLSEQNSLKKIPLLIDCAHGNSQKNLTQQKSCFFSVLKELSSKDNASLLGMMVESFINPGNQPIQKKLDYGCSITDPCLGWEETESLILSAYDFFETRSSDSSSMILVQK